MNEGRVGYSVLYMLWRICELAPWWRT